MNEFRREPEDLIAEQLEAVERVLRSGWCHPQMTEEERGRVIEAVNAFR